MEDSTQTIDPHASDEVTPTTVVAGAPTPPKTPDDLKVSDDENLIERAGKRYIREEALHAERTKAQNYAKTLETLKPLMPEFERFLAQQKGGRTATVDRATRDVDQPDYSDDELTGYAITRGYYDADNKPDLKRAQDDLAIMTAIADRRASRAVQPVAESSASDRAMRNMAAALSQQFVDGEPVAEEKYLKAVFDAVPEAMKADVNTAQMLTVVAAGLQALEERKSGRGRARREPVFRESGGGRMAQDTGESLDALDRAAARARGKSPEQWAKLSKSIGGASIGGTVLEEV